MNPEKQRKKAEIQEREELVPGWYPVQALNPEHFRKFRTRQKLQEYLSRFNFGQYEVHEMASVYFLMRYNGIIYPVYFEENDGYYMETDCELRMIPMKKKELKDFVKETYQKEYRKEALEYESMLQIGKRHYEIVCYQSTGFLPEETEILAVLTEPECVRWLIYYKYWIETQNTDQ